MNPHINLSPIKVTSRIYYYKAINTRSVSYKAPLNGSNSRTTGKQKTTATSRDRLSPAPLLRTSIYLTLSISFDVSIFFPAVAFLIVHRYTRYLLYKANYDRRHVQPSVCTCRNVRMGFLERPLNTDGAHALPRLFRLGHASPVTPFGNTFMRWLPPSLVYMTNVHWKTPLWPRLFL